MSLGGKADSFRRKVLGLNAAQERFDLLQVRADTVRDGVAAVAEDTRALRAQVEDLSGLRGGIDALRSELRGALRRLDEKMEGAGTLASAAGARGRGYRPAQGERLAFLLHTLELVNHFGCVWDLMEPGSFDVVLHGAAAAAPRDAFAAWSCNVRTSDEVIASGDPYDWVVSNQPVALGDRPLLTQLGARQVRFMYAAGKSGWNLADWNSLYDVILCFGPYHAAKFAAVSDAVVVQMGYPRFDRCFQAPPDRAELCARYGCDPARPTVVWLPTWKTLSSVGHHDAEVSALASACNVVVKLHPLMVEEEPERVEALRRHAFTCLITDASDNLPLYQLADFMLFDYGGPPLAGVYADKPMLLLEVPGAEQEAIAGPDSPDVAIRAEIAGVAPGAGRMAAMLADPAVWEQQKPVRRALRTRYFAPHYGFSADVAAAALSRLPQLVAYGR